MLFSRFGIIIKTRIYLLKISTMKLRTFYKHNEKLVLGTFAEGKTQFFFSGFNSAEEAKKELLDILISDYKKDNPNLPTSFITSWIEVSLQGEWSEIE